MTAFISAVSVAHCGVDTRVEIKWIRKPRGNGGALQEGFLAHRFGNVWVVVWVMVALVPHCGLDVAKAKAIRHTKTLS